MVARVISKKLLLPFRRGSPNSRLAVTTFKINTCKNVSKQRTLTPSRINTYQKTGGGGPPANRHQHLPRLQLRQRPSYAPRGASIPCGFSRLRILPVTTGEYYPLRLQITSYPSAIPYARGHEIDAAGLAYHECYLVSEELPAHVCHCLRITAKPPARAAGPSHYGHHLHGQPRLDADSHALGPRLRRRCPLPLLRFSVLRFVSPSARRTRPAGQDRKLRKRDHLARESGTIWKRTAHQRRRFLAAAKATEQSCVSPAEPCSLRGNHCRGSRTTDGRLETRGQAQHPQRHDECHAPHRFALALRQRVGREHARNRTGAGQDHGQLFRLSFHCVFSAHSDAHAQAPLSLRGEVERSRLRLDCSRTRKA